MPEFLLICMFDSIVGEQLTWLLRTFGHAATWLSGELAFKICNLHLSSE